MVEKAWGRGGAARARRVEAERRKVEDCREAVIVAREANEIQKLGWV